MIILGIAGYIGSGILKTLCLRQPLSTASTTLISGVVFPLAIVVGLSLTNCFFGQPPLRHIDWRFDIRETLLSKLCFYAIGLTVPLCVLSTYLNGTTQRFLLTHGHTVDLSAQKEMARIITELLAENRLLALVMLIELAILTPIAEEALYRVILPRFLTAAGLPAVISLIAAALLFALVHSPAFVIPGAFAFAAVQTFYQQRFGTLLAVMTHGLYNLAVFFFTASTYTG